MRSSNKNMLFHFSKFYLLIIYIPFFIVQGFFNFDIHTSFLTKSISSNISTRIKKQPTVAYFNTNKSKDNKASIRLNKRFQPEDSPILISPAFEMTVYFISSGLFYCYPDPEVADSHLLSNKLRGPPVVA